MEIDDEIRKLLKNKELIRIYEELSSDEEVKTLIKYANIVSIKRLGYNDHGGMHSKITTRNALHLLNLISSKVKPNIVKERLGDYEDSKLAVMLAAYLHDIGIGINRQDHEKFSVILAQPILRRMLYSYYGDNEKKISSILPIILEGIVCHMAHYKPTSIEAGIVSVADGCDMTKGRARIPFRIGERDIHEYSAMAIDEVSIKKGKRKLVKITVKMSSAAGVFQVEDILLTKLRNSGLQKYIEVESIVNERGNIYKDTY
jgi:metal-dependent HD superfamily phosphatase/phosphodiesterase